MDERQESVFFIVVIFFLLLMFLAVTVVSTWRDTLDAHYKALLLMNVGEHNMECTTEVCTKGVSR